MADLSSPLLSQYSNSSKESKSQYHCVDKTIEECMGDFRLTQFLVAIFVSISWAFDAQQTFISVFTEAEPTWHCKPNNSSCTLTRNICQIPQDSWEWDRPIYTSLISEWQLHCSNSLIKALPASSFFIGCLAGGLLLATLADSSLGRKNMLFLSCLIMSLASLLTVFSPNIWVYSGLKFVNGFGRATIGTCSLVLSTELVGKRWRGQVGVIGFFCFTLGFLSLPLIAYVNKDCSWRVLYLWTSIPTIFYCILVHFVVTESPRWLLVRGRNEEAVSILLSIAPEKSSSVANYFSNLKLEKEAWNNIYNNNNNHDDIYSAIKILLHKKWALRRLLCCMVMGFGIGFVYYGMPLGLGNLSFNLYLSTTFNALSELPSSLVTFYLISKMKRKSSFLVFSASSGICSIAIVIMGKWANWQIGLELVSFFSACTAFNILLIYTLELFPTCVRNTAISVVRQALVFGGIFSPLLVNFGRKNGFLSYAIFGLVIGICGLFVIFLKETRGESICDTIEEEEHKDIYALDGQADV